jgi:hypothetical protein
MKVKVKARARNNEPYVEASRVVSTTLSRCWHPSVLAQHPCIYTSATNRTRIVLDNLNCLLASGREYSGCTISKLSRLAAVTTRGAELAVALLLIIAELEQ